MTPPDVAALLAREPEVIAKAREHCARVGVESSAAFTYNGEQTYRIGDVLREYDALATALRAALADQRRIDWLDTQRRPYSLPPTRMIVGTEWSVKLHHQEQPNATLRAAIDAALTADGGV